MCLVGSDPDECHSDEDDSQVDELCAEVPLLEEDDGAGERDDHRTASYQRHYGNHRLRVIQRCEVCEIGEADEKRNERNGPSPLERSGFAALRIPYKTADHCHNDHLVEVEPALHEHRAEFLHYVLVVQAADGSENCRQAHAPYPFVLLEVDCFLLSRTAHQVDGEQRQQDADPLVCVQPFAEKHYGSHQHEHRPGRVDRADDRKRQVLQTEISAYPRRQHDERLQHHQQMRFYCGG